MPKKASGGTSPWSGSTKVVSAALVLHKRGIPVVGLSDDQVLKKRNELYETGSETDQMPTVRGERASG